MSSCFCVSPKGMVNQPALFPPPGEATRYVLPYYTSQTLLSGDRSVAVVNVYNQAKVSCNLTVEFQYATGITDVCSITLAIPGKESALFCSRPVADPLAPCSISCPAPGLTFNTGHAYVDSTYTIPTCANIAVDAQEVFTRDPADSPIEAMNAFGAGRLLLAHRVRMFAHCWRKRRAPFEGHHQEPEQIAVEDTQRLSRRCLFAVSLPAPPRPWLAPSMGCAHHSAVEPAVRVVAGQTRTASLLLISSLAARLSAGAFRVGQRIE